MIALLNIAALFTMMLSMGMRVRLDELLASARRMRLLALGVLANYILVPAVTVGLLILFQADPLVSAGFLVLAVCPGAPFGPPITAIARGDVPCAVGMMLILSGLSALLSPVLLRMLLTWIAPASDLRIDYVAIVQTLLIIQMVPLMLGLAIHHRAPELTRRSVKPVGLLANILLLALVGLIVVTQRDDLATIRIRGWTAMSLLLLAGFGIGWLCADCDLRTRKAMAVTTATRNAAVGLIIVTSSFAGTRAVTAVVAYSLISVAGALGCGVLLGRAYPAGTKNRRAGL
jgi:BASS family bile acid:Na+ symporter